MFEAMVGKKPGISQRALCSAPWILPVCGSWIHQALISLLAGRAPAALEKSIFHACEAMTALTPE